MIFLYVGNHFMPYFTSQKNWPFSILSDRKTYSSWPAKSMQFNVRWADWSRKLLWFLFVDFNICSSSTKFECNYSLVQQGFSFLSAALIHTLPHKCLPHVNILQFRVYLQRLLCRNILCSKFNVLVSSRGLCPRKITSLDNVVFFSRP